MAGAFGFQRYPQTPSPDPSQVGLALIHGQQGGQAAPAPMPGAAGFATSVDADMREEGARLMSGRETPTGPDDDNPAALNAAIGEALTRMGGGYATNPNPFKDRDKSHRDLRRLGMSELEAQLLGQTGGL